MSTSSLVKGGWVAAGILILASGLYFASRTQASPFRLPASASAVSAPVGDLPHVPVKQVPASYPLDGCPPEGRGGDAQLNRFKNRTDPGDYAEVSFDSLTALTWPKNAERQPMALWSEASRHFIAQYAGTPISVEGYIVNLREGPPDTAACNWDSSSYLDWHLSFTKGPRDERVQSILAEVTPRIRLNHRWTIDSVHTLIMGDHVPVRLSGWLYFDPEHPGDLGVNRSTLWEINPVMQIEVLDGSRWVPLDSMVH